MRAGRFDPTTQVFEFNHVPKCGGTTLHDFLSRLMDGRYVHCRPNTDWKADFPAAVGAGGHQLCGQNPIAHRKNREVVRLIVLREPLQRILSFHRHVRTNPEHYLARRRGVGRMGFADFVRYCDRARVPEFFDLQSHYVAGPQGDASDLNAVLTRFDAYDFYAPLPMLPVLRTELARFFGKPAEDLVARNVSDAVAVDDAEVRAVAPIVYRRNYNDLQLYHACCDKFMRFLDARGGSAAAA